MQARDVREEGSKEAPRPNIYKLLKDNLNRPVDPTNPDSLTVKAQLAKNEKSRLFDDLGIVLDPVFNEFYAVDSKSLASILPVIQTHGGQNDYKIEDEHSQALIKHWCKTIMHRARPSLLNQNNAISQTNRRKILGKTSKQLSNLDLLNAYFGAFMQHILMRMTKDNMVDPSLNDAFMAMQNYISSFTPSNSSNWALEVMDEHLHPEKRQTQLPQPKPKKAQEEQIGLSGGEIAGLVAAGLVFFGLGVGGLAVAASKKGREDHPRSNNNNNNDSPPSSPYFGHGDF